MSQWRCPQDMPTWQVTWVFPNCKCYIKSRTLPCSSAQNHNHDHEQYLAKKSQILFSQINSDIRIPCPLITLTIPNMFVAIPEVWKMAPTWAPLVGLVRMVNTSQKCDLKSRLLQSSGPGVWHTVPSLSGLSCHMAHQHHNVPRPPCIISENSMSRRPLHQMPRIGNDWSHMPLIWWWRRNGVMEWSHEFKRLLVSNRWIKKRTSMSGY